jgi:hypothetical protein
VINVNANSAATIHGQVDRVNTRENAKLFISPTGNVTTLNHRSKTVANISGKVRTIRLAPGSAVSNGLVTITQMRIGRISIKEAGKEPVVRFAPFHNISHADDRHFTVGKLRIGE